MAKAKARVIMASAKFRDKVAQAQASSFQHGWAKGYVDSESCEVFAFPTALPTGVDAESYMAGYADGFHAGKNDL